MANETNSEHLPNIVFQKIIANVFPDRFFHLHEKKKKKRFMIRRGCFERKKLHTRVDAKGSLHCFQEFEKTNKACASHLVFRDVVNARCKIIKT